MTAIEIVKMKSRLNKIFAKQTGQPLKKIEKEIETLRNNNYIEDDKEIILKEDIKDKLDKYFLEINLINETIKKKQKGNIKIDWNKVDLLKEL